MPGSPQITRASFLKRCSIFVAAAFVHPLAIFRWPARVEQLSAAFFKRYVQQTFKVRLPDHRTIRVVLASVTERPVTHGFEQFSALFRGPAPLTDGTYRFEHPSLGAIELFVVAVGPDRMTYEACFSRRVGA